MLTALHVDDALIAVDKPAGLLAVPGRGDDKQDCLSARVQAHWPGALVVHRLDMATSGPDAVRPQRASAAPREPRLRVAAHREALCRGGRRPPAGSCRAHRAAAGGRLAAPPAAEGRRRDGRPSRTDWQVIEFDAARQATRLALQPLTGRTHQLRVHLRPSATRSWAMRCMRRRRCTSVPTGCCCTPAHCTSSTLSAASHCSCAATHPSDRMIRARGTR